MRRDSPRYGNFPKRRKSRERPWNRASPAFGKLWEHVGKYRVDLENKQHRILDLNLSEVHLLKVAEQNPNYTLIEYAEKLKVSRSAITQLVNLLEKKDCVKKKKANKKSFVLELTSKGEIVCNKHDEEHKKIENDLRRIFKKYDCIFFEQLSELMSDITSTWEEYDGM